MPSVQRSIDLKGIWLFANCTNAELKKVRGSFVQAAVTEDQLVIQEGEMGTYFFVIVSGRALVKRGDRTVVELGPGDHFGELSLIDRKPHWASVVSSTEMDMLVLSRRQFERLLNTVPVIATKILRSMVSRLLDLDARVGI